MLIFELVLILMLVGVALSLAAPLLRVPWPTVLALAGTGLAFIPGMPPVQLDPELALALFFAPVLLDAAYETSPRSLRDNWRPVGSLVVVAVLLTVAAVAIVARTLVPDMPWPAAIALGAIVAPPDAAAATAVLNQIRLPQRIVLILEGESLLNDASVLLIFEGALQAAAGGVTVWTLPLLLLAAIGGIALGYGLARLYLATVVRYVSQRHMAASVLLQFMGTFGVWILAERLHLSAVLTVVAYGMTVAHHSRQRMSPRERRANFAVWEVVVFGLNVMAFLLTGLQVRGIVDRLGAPFDGLLFALAVLACCILVRLAWVMAYNTALRWARRRRGAAGGSIRDVRPAAGLVVGWAGMRGIVTLGAALALPAGFPQRELIEFTAFVVVLGTLGFQGMTLRPLIELLPMPPDTSQDEMAHARQAAARAALGALADARDTEAGEALARQYERRIAEHGRDIEATRLMRLQGRVLGAERDAIEALHRQGAISDGVYREIEEELDWAEAALDYPQSDQP